MAMFRFEAWNMQLKHAALQCSHGNDENVDDEKKL